VATLLDHHEEVSTPQLSLLTCFNLPYLEFTHFILISMISSQTFRLHRFTFIGLVLSLPTTRSSIYSPISSFSAFLSLGWINSSQK